jgi:uncharacterized membrane protein
VANVSSQVIVAAFNDQEGAGRMLESLKQAKKENQLGFEEVAVVVSEADGKVKIKDTAETSTGKGAKIGAVVGGVAGILAGPIGWAALGGAAVGGLVAKVHDGGFKDDNLRTLGDALTPGTSALIVVTDQSWVFELSNFLKAEGAKTVNSALRDDIAQQIESGQNPAYTLLDSGQMAEAAPADQPAAEATPAEEPPADAEPNSTPA